MSFKSLSSNAQSHQLQKNTPVSQPIPGREAEMARNNGGGFTFTIDDWTMLDRFLIIGTTGGSYYVTEKNQNAAAVSLLKKLSLEDGKRLVDRCVEISQAGRAKNNDFALFALAHVISFGSSEAKRYAGDNLPNVARTGTHLMHFTEFANGLRGWGKVLKQSVQKWYSAKSVDDVAFQALKYQSRDGWSQRDILRLAHVHPGDDEMRNHLYKYITKGPEGLDIGRPIPLIVAGFEQAKHATGEKLVQLIADYGLSMEMIPNEAKNDIKVWAALLPKMGVTALVRNLNKMTSVGLLTSTSDATKYVIGKLTNQDYLRRGKIHPMTLLVARKQYAAGAGKLGSLRWTPVQSIVKALEDAFYLSFATVEPTGKNRMLALDVSASMNNPVLGMDGVSCREASAVMAMVTLKTEPWAQIYGFDHKFRELNILKDDSLEVVMKKTYSPNFGSTNMSLPMELAMQQGWKVHSFEVYTDNEINQGRNSPSQALKNYRSKSGVHDAKLISVGMQMNRFSIADPKDRGMMDVAGFDTQAPQFMAQFVSGLL